MPALKAWKLAAVVTALLLCPAASRAEGRTDGAEGSEIGHGGYQSAGSGPLSLEFNWGASLPVSGPLSGVSGVPLFVGLTASYWASDWFVIDASGAYNLSNKVVDLLVGPKFRTGFSPVAANLGVKAGAMFTGSAFAFGISPQLGVDVLVNRSLLFGLTYNLDLPLGFEGHTHRLGMNLGYRF